MCIPPTVVAALARKQPQLGSFHFTTEINCVGPYQNGCKVLDFTPFRNIRSIYWHYPPWYQNMPAFLGLLENNPSLLEELELDNYSWRTLMQSFGQCRHGVPPEEQLFGALPIVPNTGEPCSAPSFPSLRVLTLSSVKLGYIGAEDLFKRLNPAILQSLTLRSCDGWERFLTLLVESGALVQLRTLEITDDSGDWAVGPILEGVEGLENLYLSLWTTYSHMTGLPEFRLWPAIARHGKTLKRVVFHQRNPHTRIDCFDSPLDMGDEEEQEATNPMEALSNLECLGLSNDPEASSFVSTLPSPFHQSPYLSLTKQSTNLFTSSQRLLLHPFTNSTTLRLLHIRQTVTDRMTHPNRQPLVLIPEDTTRWESTPGTLPDEVLQSSLTPLFRDLVDWAFSPQGIKSLQVIAWGDFAFGYKGWRTGYNLFVCRDKRDKQGWRVYDARDKRFEGEWKGLLVGGREDWRFLEAGPLGSEFGNWGVVP